MGRRHNPLRAACILRAHDAPNIFNERIAQEVAGAFDVDLRRNGGQIRPVEEIKPHSDSDKHGIAVGSLCLVITEYVDGMESQDFINGDYVETQEGLKARNLPEIDRYVLENTFDIDNFD